MLKLDVPAQSPPSIPERQVLVHGPADLPPHLGRLTAYCEGRGPCPLGYHPAWMTVLQQSMRHTPYCLEVVEGGRTRGMMALCDVRSLLFGRYLVSLPYVNYGGALADDDQNAALPIDRPVPLAK